MPTSINFQPAFRSFVLAMAVVGAGCGSSPTAPRSLSGPAGPGTPVPTPVAAGVVTSLRIGLTPVLRAPGETGQMTVEAFLSDGTSVDRTVEAQWTSQDAGVATVAPGGLVTAVGFGATRIDAVFEGKRSTVDVMVTPPGSFAAVGVVREPGRGPIAGVVVQEMDSNRSTTTNQDGVFGFAPLHRARIRVAREGFEVVERDYGGDLSLSAAGIPRLSLDIPLQPIVRLDAGASQSQLRIAADDVGYANSIFCGPCKLIRVAAGRTGTLRVTVTPQGATNAFFVFIDGKTFSLSSSKISAQAAVVSPGEKLVYVGWRLGYLDEFEPGPVSFDIATSIDDE